MKYIVHGWLTRDGCCCSLDIPVEARSLGLARQMAIAGLEADLGPSETTDEGWEFEDGSAYSIERIFDMEPGQ